MFAFAIALGFSLFIAGLAAIGWACVTCVKALFSCVGSDDDNDDNDDNDVLTDDENDDE